MVVSGPRSVWIATVRRLAPYAIQQGPLLICTSMCLRTEDARDPWIARIIGSQRRPGVFDLLTGAASAYSLACCIAQHLLKADIRRSISRLIESKLLRNAVGKVLGAGGRQVRIVPSR